MANIRARKDNGKLFFDFRYKGERCREQTALDDNPANRKKLNALHNVVTNIGLRRLQRFESSRARHIPYSARR
ncbi:MAG: DUF3596 domain-containing protein [Gammaproteobacteria bacterium]|nr:DUF3596 domain-containing protein [Gammaproteobacteria bacterium]MBU1655996.1 DUF3596 domain-containing protein [Gammaproteobacteria bacterium]MBU1962204.1 DUF3596 domain-containing protein [Gammaproteobacteria bacterium]